MSTYKDKYIKYKKKYINLKHGGSDGKREEKNLFIFISNTYKNTENFLPGVIEDRNNIIKAFGWDKENHYNRLFGKSCVSVSFIKEDSSRNIKGLRFILLNDCDSKELITYIEQIKRKYRYSSITLCIDAHGGNASGIALFSTPKKELIYLADIINLFNKKELLNITILLDLCRTGEFKDESKAYNFLDTIRNKRVAIMTASWRGETASDTQKGGYLIQSLVKSINTDYDIFINSLLSFKYNIKLIDNTIINFLNIRLATRNLNIKTWEEQLKIKKENSIIRACTTFKKYIEQICKKLPSIYFNQEARIYLEGSKIEKKFRQSFFKHLELICRDYTDINATLAIKGTKLTQIGL